MLPSRGDLLLDTDTDTTASSGYDQLRSGRSGRQLHNMIIIWWLVIIVQVTGLTGALLTTNLSTAVVSERQFEQVLQSVTSHCYGLYSPECVQFEFLTQLDRLLTTTDYEVLPGVYLSRHEVALPSLAPGLTVDMDTLGRQLEATTRTVNNLLAERMFEQLRTWSISVHVFANSTLDQLRRVMDLYLLDTPDLEVETGRKSKFWKYMGSALLTVAFSILSALISKSLTLSVVALALTLLGSLGQNFGFGSPASHAVHYRSPPPVRSHVSHSSEVQYVDEVPDDGGAQPYVYVNRKAWKNARSVDDVDRLYSKYYEHLM